MTKIRFGYEATAYGFNDIADYMYPISLGAIAATLDELGIDDDAYDVKEGLTAVIVLEDSDFDPEGGELPERDEVHYEQLRCEVIKRAAEYGIPAERLQFYRDDAPEACA